ncbi:MAG: hypothetical protein E7634_03235 [Ruminococcaceae bacterium]|nr:hypothetical protein [Oscillospiraceae bacterium]
MDKNDKRSNLIRIISYAAKAIVFYVIFTATAFFSGEMLRITGSGRNWRGFWSDELFCSVNLFYSLVVFFTLSEIILLNDNYLKIQFSDYTNGGRKPCSPTKKLIFILSRPQLWIDIAVLSVFSLYFSGSVPFSDLRNGFPDFFFCLIDLEMPFLLAVLGILKITAYFTCLSRWQQNPQALRTDVATLTIVNKITERSLTEQLAASVSPALKILVIAVLWIVGAFPLALCYPMIVMAFKIGNLALIPVISILTATAISFFLLRRCKQYYIRHKIIKKIKFICTKKGYAFNSISKHHNPQGYDFAIEHNGKSLFCSFLGVPSKKTVLCINENGNAEKEFQRLFWKHTVSENYTFECPSIGKKLLIIIPSTEKLFAKDEYSQSPITYGSSVLEYKIEDERGAVRYIDSLYL